MCKSLPCYLHVLYRSTCILLSAQSACWVFKCFRNPLNSDMDYGMFNVHTWSFLGWAHRQRVSTTFVTRKNSHFFLVLLTGFEPRRSLGSWVQRSTHWATPSPLHVKRPVSCLGNAVCTQLSIPFPPNRHKPPLTLPLRYDPCHVFANAVCILWRPGPSLSHQTSTHFYVPSLLGIAVRYYPCPDLAMLPSIPFPPNRHKPQFTLPFRRSLL